MNIRAFLGSSAAVAALSLLAMTAPTACSSSSSSSGGETQADKDKAAAHDYYVARVHVVSGSCIGCHGADRAGNKAANIPSLLDVDKRLTREQAMEVITKGRGVMPP